MKSNLISVVIGITIIVFVLNFTSCKVSMQNESTATKNYSNQPLIVFLNCSISYDSIGNNYKIDLIDKTITEGRIKKTIINSHKYEQGDFKYCLLNKNKQIINCYYMPDPLNKTIEYVDDNNRFGKKNIRLDNAFFSLRIQLTADCKYVSFEKNKKQLQLVTIK